MEEEKVAIELTEDQLDDLLSDKISRMVPVIEYIRETYCVVPNDYEGESN